jgi:hypothetical protein
MKSIKLKKAVTLIAALTLLLTLSSCTAQNQNNEKNSYDGEEKVSYDLSSSSLLRYSTTGYLLIDGKEYSFVHPETNPPYSETGIQLDVTQSLDKHGVESITLTHAKIKETPIVRLAEYVPDLESKINNTEKFISTNGPSMENLTNEQLIEEFSLSAESSLAYAFDKSLAKNIRYKLGSNIDIYNQKIKLIHSVIISKRVTIDGGSIEGFIGKRDNTYIKQETTDNGEFYVDYYDEAGIHYFVAVTLAELPYYDLNKKELVANWVISDPEVVPAL